jgi:transposase
LVESLPLWQKESRMAKSKRYQQPYTPEFRARILELLRAGRAISGLEKEFGVSEVSIRAWRKQHELDEGVRTDGATSDEKAELAKLRRENERLREERDILKKAAAWFAQEAESTLKRRSDS